MGREGQNISSPSNGNQQGKLTRPCSSSCSVIVKVVMEYLVKEGFKDAVSTFQEESGIDPGVNMAMLDDQIKIRDAVEVGV